MTRTGGCQCGAVRFSVEAVGRTSVCYCRMCQKATGGFMGAYAATEGLVWTRGEPSHFHSSNLARRGFCAACGTPLSFEAQGWPVTLSIAAFDDPASIPPILQVSLGERLPNLTRLDDLPTKLLGQVDRVVSHQHPDHDTAVWPPA